MEAIIELPHSVCLTRSL